MLSLKEIRAKYQSPWYEKKRINNTIYFFCTAVGSLRHGFDPALILILGFCASPGVIFYGLLSYLFKMEELKFVLSLIRKKPSEVAV
ncbi:MAG: hypothetical protein Q8L26_02350 [Candidatus Omnitrophota bacterium]|nr:hypothetical protein [Candidatus Omnitrophota bacterium]